jgi:hypothetical protein
MNIMPRVAKTKEFASNTVTLNYDQILQAISSQGLGSHFAMTVYCRDLPHSVRGPAPANALRFLSSTISYSIHVNFPRKIKGRMRGEERYAISWII